MPSVSLITPDSSDALQGSKGVAKRGGKSGCSHELSRNHQSWKRTEIYKCPFMVTHNFCKNYKSLKSLARLVQLLNVWRLLVGQCFISSTTGNCPISFRFSTKFGRTFKKLPLAARHMTEADSSLLLQLMENRRANINEVKFQLLFFLASRHNFFFFC